MFSPFLHVRRFTRNLNYLKIKVIIILKFRNIKEEIIWMNKALKNYFVRNQLSGYY